MRIWYHPDGAECPHKRCKRRARVYVRCDTCKLDAFECRTEEMWDVAKRQGWKLRTTGQSYCKGCWAKRNDYFALGPNQPAPKTGQLELWPE